MKRILITVACFATLSATAQNREIEFKETAFKTNLAQAKKDHKLIFLDAYTSWCGPCKMMAKDVFTKDSVADLFNQTFLNVKYDMEKGEGPELKNKFEVKAYPTYLFINGDGEVVHRIVGSMSPAEFMKEAEKALNPETTVFGLGKKFDGGDHSEKTAVAYLQALENAYEADKMGVVAKIYFDGLPQNSLMEKHNWELALKYLNNPSSKAFNYLYEHKAELEKEYGADTVNNYFQQTLHMSAYSVKRAYEEKKMLDEAKERATAMRKILTGSSAPSYSKSLLIQLDLTQYAGTGQWDKFCVEVNKTLLNKDKSQNGIVITSANDIVSHAPAKYYPNALKWADKVERQDPNLFEKIQLADLRKRTLKKMGKQAESDAMALKAESLRKEAATKGQMTPPMMKD